MIETLTVAIIVSVLASIAIPVFLNRRVESWRGSVRSDLRNAAIAFEAVATNNNGQYPLTIPEGVMTSPDVTLVLGPTASTSRLCLKGNHTRLSDSIYYDSSAGGLTTVAC